MSAAQIVQQFTNPFRSFRSAFGTPVSFPVFVATKVTNSRCKKIHKNCWIMFYSCEKSSFFVSNPQFCCFLASEILNAVSWNPLHMVFINFGYNIHMTSLSFLLLVLCQSLWVTWWWKIPISEACRRACGIVVTSPESIKLHDSTDGWWFSMAIWFPQKPYIPLAALLMIYTICYNRFNGLMVV